jgi:hypothetical protein
MEAVVLQKLLCVVIALLAFSFLYVWPLLLSLCATDTSEILLCIFFYVHSINITTSIPLNKAYILFPKVKLRKV